MPQHSSDKRLSRLERSDATKAASAHRDSNIFDLCDVGHDGTWQLASAHDERDPDLWLRSEEISKRRHMHRSSQN